MKTRKRFQILLFISLLFISISTAVATLGRPGLKANVPNGLDTYLLVQAHEKIAGAVTCEKTLFVKRDRRQVMVTCGIMNQSSSHIKSMKGVLRFSDYFGSPLVEMPLTVEGPLAPGAESSQSMTLLRSHFTDEASFESFLRTPLSRMRQAWIPTELVLADGRILKP